MWASKRDLAEEYSISVRTVDRILTAIIRPRIGSWYPADTEIYIGGRVRIDKDAFHDALVHRREYQLGIK